MSAFPSLSGLTQVFAGEGKPISTRFDTRIRIGKNDRGLH